MKSVANRIKCDDAKATSAAFARVFFLSSVSEWQQPLPAA